MNLPHLTFPKPLARLVGALPSGPASHAFVTAGNLLAWPTLRDLDWTGIYGRHFCVSARDTGLKVYFSVQPQGFQVERSGPVDVTFTATAQDFARPSLRLEDPDTLFFNRRLLIEGDTDPGLRVKNMLDGVELETAAQAMPAGIGRILMRLRRLAAD
jgi:predicted lipid carrier protein YhbT